MKEILDRREYTNSRINDLISNLDKASKLLAGKACVYATGSFGRLEASKNSDLDLFIVGLADSTASDGGHIRASRLSRLDEICIKAELIEATRALSFPDFDGDGKYLAHYSVDDLTKKLGKPDDDAANTLTGRLLLFLESRPLLGNHIYDSIIKDVVATYWRDYADHSSNFTPAYLANDILRLWRTFCVNYEARTVRNPENNKIKGKIKNYKLKHSRMLTCYSALAYLLAKYCINNTVSIEDAITMTSLTPTQRLEDIMEEKKLVSAKDDIARLLEIYNNFLIKTSQGDSVLEDIFSDQGKSKLLMDDSYKFGDSMHNAIKRIGGDSRLYRLMVV